MNDRLYPHNRPASDILIALACFIASFAITARFVYDGSEHYSSDDSMMLSTVIAGTKWGLQIIAAFLFLGIKKWAFIRRISVVCLVGSVALLPYCMLESQQEKENYFFGSLILSVLIMIPLYYMAVQKMKISLLWFIGWFTCLAIAIMLQLVVVFQALY